MTPSLIHDDMLIGDVLARYPESAQIMQDFGLSCTSCSVNSFEPIRAGALSHGMPEENVDQLMEALNELATARQQSLKDGFYVTSKAAEKIQEFAETEGKSGQTLRITAHDNNGMEPAYAMDFEEESKKDDKTFEFHGVKVHLDAESVKNLNGAEVDYLDTSYGSGFKIYNPQFTGGGCACGNTGGCGCGSGESGESCGCH